MGIFYVIYLLKNKNYHRFLQQDYQDFNLDEIEGNFYVESVYDGDTIIILVPIKLSIFDMVEKDKINLNSNSNSLNEIKLKTKINSPNEIK